MGFEDKIERTRYGDPKKAVDEGMARANLEVGRAIAAQAKLFAPVDQGQLRNSISAANLRTSVLLNIDPGEQARPISTAGLKGDEVYVGANVEHAAPQEYGTGTTRAQPYLRPAKEMVVDGKKAGQIIEEWSKEAMKKELKNKS